VPEQLQNGIDYVLVVVLFDCFEISDAEFDDEIAEFFKDLDVIISMLHDKPGI
jgi:hypothetical protein